jgi:hypothetical protein
MSEKNNMKFGVMSDVAPCSDVEVHRRFRGAYYLHFRPGDARSTHL